MDIIIATSALQYNINVYTVRNQLYKSSVHKENNTVRNKTRTDLLILIKFIKLVFK